MITSTKKQGYDVIVVGGGIAGCCAALAAATCVKISGQ